MLSLEDILQAKTYSDLFKEGTKKELRSLLKQAHPDLHPGNVRKAEKAFIHINTLWGMKSSPSVSSHKPSAPTVPSDIIITRKHEYRNLKSVRKNNGVETFHGLNEHGERAFLMVATHPRIGELLMEGVKNLKHVKNSINNPNYLELFPNTTDAFRIIQEGKKMFGAALSLPEVNYSLREVQEDYPEGIDGRDVAWMYRRMLVAVGNMHDHGFAHGCPNLDAFLITPETHALQLTNYQFSKPLGETISMSTPDTKRFYETDKVVTGEKDLRILSEAILSLLDSKAPSRLRNFLKAMVTYPTSTAQEALGEFDELLSEIYGPRTFHVFKMRRS